MPLDGLLTAGLIGTAAWPPTAAALRVLRGVVCASSASPGGAAGRCRRRHRALRRHGRSRDARELFQRLSLLLFPLPRGSGMKAKTLEAIASGVPVVTTPPAPRASRPQTASSSRPSRTGWPPLRAPATDDKARRERGAAARKTFEQRYSPGPATEPLVELDRRRCAAAPPRSGRSLECVLRPGAAHREPVLIRADRDRDVRSSRWRCRRRRRGRCTSRARGAKAGSDLGAAVGDGRGAVSRSGRCPARAALMPVQRRLTEVPETGCGERDPPAAAVVAAGRAAARRSERRTAPVVAPSVTEVTSVPTRRRRSLRSCDRHRRGGRIDEDGPAAESSAARPSRPGSGPAGEPTSAVHVGAYGSSASGSLGSYMSAPALAGSSKSRKFGARPDHRPGIGFGA